MDLSELLAFLAETFDDLDVRYLVTGSMATVFFGEPRFTNDIDVVLELDLAKVERFCQRFPAADFYLSEPAIREAVHHHSQFNIIHPTSGLKVDVMIPDDSPFNRSRLSRVVREKTSDDVEICFASPEDVIIKKMEYYRLGGSEKHLRDITGVLKVCGERVDRSYIDGWAERLDLAEIWQAITDRMTQDPWKRGQGN